MVQVLKDMTTRRNCVHVVGLAAQYELQEVYAHAVRLAESLHQAVPAEQREMCTAVYGLSAWHKMHTMHAPVCKGQPLTLQCCSLVGQRLRCSAAHCCRSCISCWLLLLQGPF